MSIRGKIEAVFRKRPDLSPAPAAAPVAASGIPAEVVAAIAGAVAIVCGDGAVVTGIRPVAARREAAGRSAWSMAGLLETTRPF